MAFDWKMPPFLLFQNKTLGVSEERIQTPFRGLLRVGVLFCRFEGSRGASERSQKLQTWRAEPGWVPGGGRTCRTGSGGGPGQGEIPMHGPGGQRAGEGCPNMVLFILALYFFKACCSRSPRPLQLHRKFSVSCFPILNNAVLSILVAFGFISEDRSLEM